MAPIADGVPRSAAPTQAIHRDLNPGNILWHRGRAVGIVDWVNLCVGPIEEDIGRCRVNIALLAGLGPADAYLAEIRAAGVDYDTTWDLAVLADMVSTLDGMLAANELGAQLTEPLVHQRAEALVHAAT
jgi:aminoglycoside phosphotransferase (APT) family kinase protein